MNAVLLPFDCFLVSWVASFRTVTFHWILHFCNRLSKEICGIVWLNTTLVRQRFAVRLFVVALLASFCIVMCHWICARFQQSFEGHQRDSFLLASNLSCKVTCFAGSICEFLNEIRRNKLNTSYTFKLLQWNFMLLFDLLLSLLFKKSLHVELLVVCLTCFVFDWIKENSGPSTSINFNRLVWNSCYDSRMVSINKIAERKIW